MASESSTKTSTVWPKYIYAFYWKNNDMFSDLFKTQTKKIKQPSYEMSGKLVLEEINVGDKCEMCYRGGVQASSYSGKLVCQKCAIFLQRLYNN